MRIYYASDVHGSEVCWRKFLNAGSFYRADVLIMGGDIVGKAIIPIEITPRAPATAVFRGKRHELASAQEIETLEKEIRNAGFYPFQAGRDELAHFNESDAAREALFERVVRHEIDRWMAIAQEKHRPEVRVYVMCGNDDPWFVDDQLRNAEAVTFSDDSVVTVDEFELVSLSYANRTPWNSPRELDEDTLFAKIARLADQVREPDRAIFNLHVPPYGSGLDDAPHLDATLKPITRGGQVEMVAVGSTAVRAAIERYQPLLGLHGHIHESRGVRTIGRTVVINPGSEYGSGRIHGAVIEWKKGRLRSHQLVSG
jgi:Icc-related predicted phosphoesterase